MDTTVHSLIILLFLATIIIYALGLKIRRQQPSHQEPRQAGPIDKSLYKTLIRIIRFYPFVLSFLYLAGSLMTCFDCETTWMVLLCKTSFLSLCILIITSHCLDFCVRHRLPLYYVFLCNVTDAVHTYAGGPDILYFWIYISLFILLHILIFCHYVTNRSCHSPANH